MGLRNWYRSRQLAKAQAYLTRHPDLAVEALRRNETMAAQAVSNFYMQAAANFTERQTIQYPILNQLGTGGRQTVGQSLPKVTPFNLRRFSEYPPARRAINAICNPILDMPWTIEPIAQDRRGSRRADEISVEHELQIAIATRVLREPNYDDSWRSLLEMVLEDMVVGGYGAIELVCTGNILRPYDLYPVDGQSIRINLAWDHNTDPDEHRYSQALGYVGIGVGTHEPVKLKDEELIYIKFNPRTNTPFGLGYLEIAYLAINAWIGAFEYAERRASNATPNFGIFLGENMTPDQVRRWQQYWEEMIEGYGKVPILGGGKAPSTFALTGTGEDQLWIGWQEFLLRVIAMSFGISAQKLSLERDVNRNTAEVQAVADWETVAPVANTVEDYLTHKFLWKRLGFRDLEFKWVVKEADERRQAEILEARWNMNAITADEIREFYEQEPLPDGIGSLVKAQLESMAQAMTLPDPGLGGMPLDEELEERDDMLDEEPDAMPTITMADIAEMPDDLRDLLSRAKDLTNGHRPAMAEN